ncbi:flagellar biosynthetic protein FliO [Desulfovirgula thermocuniculi]|uniref:flagellar biosynthetic protein FliO n=1 Tax=Desulfovirgula thermocuniculi TaxID=348842 RepID=UPI00041F9376|nr:flagellar biosynthetic protein FliO [Desulfovirgula thermocuniculi]
MGDREFFLALLRLAVALPLVAGLAYLAVRFGLGRRVLAGRGRYMRIVEQLPLGPKACLTLVQVGRRYYLLAHQENALALLRELEELPEPLPQGGAAARPFREELAAALLRLKAKPQNLPQDVGEDEGKRKRT